MIYQTFTHVYNNVLSHYSINKKYMIYRISLTNLTTHHYINVLKFCYNDDVYKLN